MSDKDSIKQLWDEHPFIAMGSAYWCWFNYRLQIS